MKRRQDGLAARMLFKVVFSVCRRLYERWSTTQLTAMRCGVTWPVAGGHVPSRSLDAISFAKETLAALSELRE